jgi:hypothetical protein
MCRFYNESDRTPLAVRNSNAPLSLHSPTGKINGPAPGRAVRPVSAKKTPDFGAETRSSPLELVPTEEPRHLRRLNR